MRGTSGAGALKYREGDLVVEVHAAPGRHDPAVDSFDQARAGKQVELVVQGFGRTFGRFLLTPTPGLRVTFDRRIIAIALSDQVAAAFLTETAMNDH